MTFKPYPQPLYIRVGGSSRPSGVHLSGVLRYIAQVTGTVKNYDEDLENVLAEHPGPHKGTAVRFALGFAWEDWMAKRVPGLIHQPGSMCLDGVWMSPDGLDCDLTLHEFKLTFKSSRHPITSNTLWMWQACGYLKGYQAQYGEGNRTAIFHPLYVRGDYKGIDSEYKPEAITFEQAEIDSVWDMVLRNKDHVNVKKEGE